MNESERPELGTTEAAVRACVNLIALATHTGEEHLAYWLDLYYQTRVAHEKTAPPLDFSQLMNAQEPVLVKLDELEARIADLDCVAKNLQCVVSGMLTLPEYKNPGRTAWHSIVPPTPPDIYPPAPPRPAGRIKPEDLAADQNPAAEFIKQFTEEDEDGGPSRTPAPTDEAGGRQVAAPTEDVKSAQPAARQMPHDVEAEESERPEPPAAQKKTEPR